MARHGGSATTDVDADCVRLAEAGTPVRGPDEPPWGRMASFTDPRRQRSDAAGGGAPVGTPA
ncbi:VOC family protein [Streptomyces pseudovenezuelae]|uniref:VOC family protein n=1 Tax=Streptomyces pseudovenezuelae TaxID=67350 RepID=UPI003715B4AD